MFYYWTFSKIIPYIVSIVGGIFLSYLLSKSTSKIRIIRFFIWLIPLVIYFIFNPVYEDDFSNNYREIHLKKELVSSNENQLIVITIPNCLFCFESIKTIKEIKKRVPTLNVKYIVCSKDSSSIDLYKKEIDGSFQISNCQNPKEWGGICQGKFPSYLLIANKSNRIWSNDNFGTFVKDEIEEIFD